MSLPSSAVEGGTKVLGHPVYALFIHLGVNNVDIPTVQKNMTSSKS